VIDDGPAQMFTVEDAMALPTASVTDDDEADPMRASMQPIYAGFEVLPDGR